MKIFVIRHGETEWNREEIFRGKRDIPLNENGRDQAKKTAIFLAPFRINRIYSSPLVRAKETASIIGESHSVPVEIAEEFSDMNFGTWEGLSLREVQDLYPEEFNKWKNNPQGWKVEGAETLKDVRRRVFKGLKKLIKNAQDNDKIALVTHRVICKIIAMIFLGIPNSGFWRVKFDPASVSIFEKNDVGFTTTLINGTFHLKDASFSYKDF
ncbi:MAG: histidine phosphatase family protein [Deltaproteobacteria bacterium]|nr:histidine phosphatase family protein [Deltaproteobacteria bacterium]